MSGRVTTDDRVILLMSLIPYLTEHGPTSVTELATEFNVRPQLIRSLVTFLGMAGVPGETRTYQDEDLFDIDWDAFEMHDLVCLKRTVAVDDIPRFSSLESAALIAGLHSLNAVLPGNMRTLAQDTAKKLARLSPADSSSQAVSVSELPVHSKLSEIATAITEHRRLSFEYRDAHGESSDRTVDPLLLTQLGDSWYLRAYCYDRSAERTFLIDRLRAPKVLEQRATHIPTAMQSNALFEIEDSTLTVEVLATKAGLQQLRGFSPAVVSESSNGWYRAEINLFYPEAAVRLVQAAPGEVTIESPVSAKSAVRDWVERAIRRYEA